MRESKEIKLKVPARSGQTPDAAATASGERKRAGSAGMRGLYAPDTDWTRASQDEAHMNSEPEVGSDSCEVRA